VQIRPRASGVVRSVNVALGAKVKKGQILAVLDSPEVGKERLNLRAKQRELATIRFEADWKKQIGENVAALVPLLRKRVDAPMIQKQFANRPLGTFRSSMLDAYAKFDITWHEEEKTIGMRKEGLVGEHPMTVAIHNREGAQGVFEGIVEQATFDANQQFKVAQRDVRSAEETVIEAAQRLRILGVQENVQNLLDHAGESTLNALADEDVTAYEITAPFDGTILTRAAVPSQKVETSDVLFTLADVSTIWVMVNIPESDFALLPALKNGKIRVSSTAYPGPPFEAKLLSVGATVDSTTRTVPMIAEARNPDDLLKLGMFVRISLDTTVQTKALTVPASAVIEIEGKTGVFQPDAKDPRTFHFTPVAIGREAGDRLVLASGLIEGAQVVCKGAFELKSELILQSQNDEE
jgi:membrane fusion protein, heavy metal efflux system